MIHTEKHTAVVAVNEDPESRGRIKVKCAGILGSEDAIFQRWAEPCFQWGFFIVPDIGEQVEIEVTSSSDRDESPGQSFLEAPNVRYRGKRFYGPDTPISDFFTEANYGKRRGFATPGGHVLMFDDTEGGRKINLAWYSGTGNEYSMVSIDEKGSIILSNKNGSLVYLNADAGEASIIDEHGNLLTLNSDGFNLIDKNSNIIKSKGGDVQLLAQNSMVVSGKAAQLDAGDAFVGQAIAGVGSKATMNALDMKLGSAATLGIARTTDLVAVDALMSAWISAVSAALSIAAPSDFGVIAGGSSKAKAE